MPRRARAPAASGIPSLYTVFVLMLILIPMLYCTLHLPDLVCLGIFMAFGVSRKISGTVALLILIPHQRSHWPLDIKYQIYIYQTSNYIQKRGEPGSMAQHCINGDHSSAKSCNYWETTMVPMYFVFRYFITIFLHIFCLGGVRSSSQLRCLAANDQT